MVEGGDCAKRLAPEEDEGAAQRLPRVADDGVGIEGVERGGGRRADERAQAAPRGVHAVEGAAPAVPAGVRDVAEREVVEGALALDVDPRLVEQPGEVQVVRLRQRGVRRRPPHPPANRQLHGAPSLPHLRTLTYPGRTPPPRSGNRSGPGAGERSGRGGDRGREAQRQLGAGDTAARISRRWRPDVK
jgi:hypothetical protein